MKVYKIKVNGKVYEVEVEVTEKEGSISNEPVTEKNHSISTKSDNDDREIVKAPMQGVIRSIKVKTGDRVQKGDVLLVFEAMKMENEILANTSGVVEEIIVKEGKNVNNNDPLLVIR